MASRYGSPNRFGVRYGRKIKDKLGKVEEARKKDDTCPYCRKHGAIKREAAGIWQCTKCNSKFTGRAYHIGRKLTAGELPVEEKPEEPEDDEELEEEQKAEVA